MEEIRSCSVNLSYIEKAEALQERPEFKTLEIEATNLKDCYVLTPKKFGDNIILFNKVFEIIIIS